MVSKVAIHGRQTCVWMDAGILTYKLCDRGFDCEHCPLDAALRGTTCARFSREPSPEARSRGELEAEAGRYPDDRQYSSTHTWIKKTPGSADRVRFGLDGFIAMAMPEPAHVRLAAPPTRVERGDRICEIRFERGELRLTSPVAGEVVDWNRELGGDPGAVARSPYEAGWIAELRLDEPIEAAELSSANEASEQARLDARHFRRRMAFQLLAGDLNGSMVSRKNGDGQLYADIRQWLGWPQFFALLQEVVG
jgi:glycine cleavage system H protein